MPGRMPKDATRENARRDFTAKVLAWSGLESIPRLEEALTHPSYSNEAGTSHNQRLEFLGDAVLGLCVSELLHAQFPEADEGALTRMRSRLVSADALAEFAASQDLANALLVGRGALASGEHQRKNVLADAIEAVVASVYLAGSLQGARGVVGAIVRERLATTDHHARDPKSELQERVQANGSASPRYELIESRGSGQHSFFVVEVLVDGEPLGRGEGGSKKEAERAAAQAALAGLSEIPH